MATDIPAEPAPVVVPFGAPADDPTPRRRGRKPRSEATAIDGEPQVEAIARRGARRLEWSEEDQTIVAVGFALMLASLSSWSAAQFHEPALGMAAQEAEMIGKPASRILLRHIHIKAAARGDVADAIALLTAIASYTSRVMEARAARLDDLRQQVNGVMARA